MGFSIMAHARFKNFAIKRDSFSKTPSVWKKILFMDWKLVHSESSTLITQDDLKRLEWININAMLGCSNHVEPCCTLINA